MDNSEHSALVYRRILNLKFQITDFKESPSCGEKTYYLNPQTNVCINIYGKGKLREDFDYVMLSIKNVDDKHTKYTVICSCTVSILDVEGEKKLPRAFEFLLRIDSFNKNVEHSERYVTRSFILDSASEYLHKDTLIVVIEGILEQWVEPGDTLREYWNPDNCTLTFKIDESRDFKVYLLKDSMHAHFLYANSSVYRVMWYSPMRESIENCFLLRNEELPAFLCMLFFVETGKLIFCETTIFDLYTIAHRYDIPLMLKECRKYIENYLSEIVPSVLNFVNCYADNDLGISTTENVQDVLNFETDNYLFGHIIYGGNIFPSKFINTEYQLEKYIRKLGKEIMKICQNSSVIANWTPENIAFNFNIKTKEQNMKVCLKKDSEYANFFKNYSRVFRELLDTQTPENADNFFLIRNEELKAFLCMLCFLETKNLILLEVTVFDLHKIGHKYDVPMLVEECRKYIERILSKTVSDILTFARFYDDDDLERTVQPYLEKYSLGRQGDDPNFEVGCLMCHKCPDSSNSIQSSDDFKEYLEKLWDKVKNFSEINNSEVVAHYLKSDVALGRNAFEFYK